MYIRYIHKLYDLHLKAQNYTGTFCGDRFFFFYTLSYFAVLNILVLIFLELFHF